MCVGSESRANGLFGLIIKHLHVAHETPSDEFIVPPVKKTFVLIPEMFIEGLLYVRPCAGVEDVAENKTTPAEEHAHSTSFWKRK